MDVKVLFILVMVNVYLSINVLAASSHRSSNLKSKTRGKNVSNRNSLDVAEENKINSSKGLRKGSSSSSRGNGGGGRSRSKGGGGGGGGGGLGSTHACSRRRAMDCGYGGPGPVGPPGAPGQPGPQGVQGTQGVQGIQGAAGIPGAHGIPGNKGQKGNRGSKGTKGECDHATLPPPPSPSPTSSSVTTVAFSATMDHDLPRSPEYRVVIFNVVLTNIGDSYNEHSGIFTTPFNGTYMIGFSGVSFTGQDVLLHLVRNGQRILSAFDNSGCEEDDGDPGKKDKKQCSGMASNMVVLSLAQGDKLWVELPDEYGLHNALYHNYATFYGTMLVQHK